MAYQRVRDLLQHLQELHDRLRRAAERAAEGESDHRGALLSSYIQEREARIQQALAKAAPAGDRLVLDTWLQFAPNEEIEGEIEELGLDSSEDVEGLFTSVLKAENALVRLYQILEAESHSPRVQEFFQALAELEGEALKRLSRAWQESVEG